MIRRFQNKVAESTLTLPIACVLTTLLWLLPQGYVSLDYVLGWLCCVLTVYVIVEMVNVNALMRNVRSRMASSLYLFLIAAFGFLHSVSVGSVVALLLLCSFFSLFRVKENHIESVDVFHSGLCIGLGSVMWPPLMLVAPVIYICLVVFFRCLSRRTAGALTLGLLLPYWLWGTAAWTFFDFTPFWVHVTAIISPFKESFYWLPVVEQVLVNGWTGFRSEAAQLIARHQPESYALALVVLLWVTGFIHYLRKNYDDKIHVRMCYYCIMTMQVVLVTWLFLQPMYFTTLFPMLLIMTVPTAAHFFTFTHTWLTNAWFLVCTFLYIAVAVVCLLPIMWAQ